MKKKLSKKSRIVGSVISAAVLAALIFLAVYLISNREMLTGEAISRLFGHLIDDESDGSKGYAFDVYSDNVFGELSGGLISASGVSIQVFNENGGEIAHDAVSLSSPAVESGSKRAAVWDVGTTTLMLLGTSGRIMQLDVPGRIISVSLNSNDWLALCSEEPGYKGSVTVYNPDREVVYMWYSGTGYILDADVSPGNGKMAATTMTDKGGRAIIFSLDSETERGVYLTQDDIGFDIEFLTDNRICLLSDNSLTILDADAKPVGIYDFSGEYLRDYSLKGSGFSVLLLSDYKTGDTCRLATVNSSGEEITSANLASEVKSIRACGKYIAVVFPGAIAVYDEKLQLNATITDASGFIDAFITSDGKILAVTAAQARLYTQ